MAVERLQWFPFYPDDWLLSATVSAMSLEAQGIFVRLLCWQAREGAIPAELDAVLRLVPGGSQQSATEALVAFPKVNGRQRKNRRLADIMKRQKSRHDKAVAAGRKGAETRWGSHPSPNGDSMPRDERDRKKERASEPSAPSGGTNSVEASYDCEDCGAQVVGFLAFSKHMKGHAAQKGKA